MADKTPISKMGAVISLLPSTLFIVLILALQPPLGVIAGLPLLAWLLFLFNRHVLAESVWKLLNPRPTQPKFILNGYLSYNKRDIYYVIKRLSGVCFVDRDSFFPHFGWEPSYWEVSKTDFSDLTGVKYEQVQTTFTDLDEAQAAFIAFSDLVQKKKEQDRLNEETAKPKIGDLGSFNTETGDVFIK